MARAIRRNRAASLLLLRPAFALAIEACRHYHAPWIDAIRRTTPGGLTLGSEFVPSDPVCDTAGVALGVLLDGSPRLAGRRPEGEES